ncbi:NAD(P)H-quinone oxidoreductase [Olivibacter sitiensis]|uniref:NAD(P)H-quinone oxidoreductase n=1 Tax=Olivibacter sitiensis TaxID=376470 RepID=UPI000485D971|nr:NAD(P)H-quinone oxidoreductase [Olivibacter sitiensis]
MKAIVISAPGGPEVLRLEERDKPSFAVNEVLIKVKAAGVNRPDVFQRKGNYPAPPGVPADIPGLEVAGTIAACGVDVEQWKVGDRVCALVAGGGYAEYVVVDAAQCLPIPLGFNFTEAASLPETVYTVWSNVFQRGRLSPMETLLVHGGSSGIGITAIQLAKAFGAKVFVTVGSDEKGAACLQLGADRYVNYKLEDFAEAFADDGVDVILDMIGAEYFERNIQVLKTEGRLVFINAMKGNAATLDIMKVMRKRISISGSTLRNRETAFKAALTKEIGEKVWPIMEAGEFKPVIYKTFPLEEAYQAHALMESSAHIGKIVLVVDDEK